MINPDNPAFPTNGVVNVHGVRVEESSPGLHIRAELAARAMQAILTNLEFTFDSFVGPEVIAAESVRYADALIKELNK